MSLYQAIFNLYTKLNGPIVDAHSVSGEPIPLPSVEQPLTILKGMSPDKWLRPESGLDWPRCADFSGQRRVHPAINHQPYTLSPQPSPLHPTPHTPTSNPSALNPTPHTQTGGRGRVLLGVEAAATLAASLPPATFSALPPDTRTV